MIFVLPGQVKQVMNSRLGDDIVGRGRSCNVDWPGWLPSGLLELAEAVGVMPYHIEHLLLLLLQVAMLRLVS